MKHENNPNGPGATRQFRIDLYSDTQTRPTDEMRKAVASAEVGDEQMSEDPTVAALIEKVCKLLGQEDAVFLPSGTMANEIAILVHCRQGDEVLAHTTSHVINFEGGAPAAFAGVMFRHLTGDRGLFDAKTLSQAIRPDSRYFARQRLLVVEQTANLGGGTVWPAEQMREVVCLARDAGLAVHLDGARLMNAVVASKCSAKDFASQFDTVFMDFTKGLGAPLGAMLAGKKQFIDDAWRWKQRMGGAMRQAGMMAAACIYALDHHVDRLAEDHANARILVDALSKIEGVSVQPADTNLVYFDLKGVGINARQFSDAIATHGVRVSIVDDTTLRAVTHLDTSRRLVEEAAEVMIRVLSTAKAMPV